MFMNYFCLKFIELTLSYLPCEMFLLCKSNLDFSLFTLHFSLISLFTLHFSLIFVTFAKN